MFARCFSFFMLIVLTSDGTSLAQTRVSLDKLSWLSGCWEARELDTLIEEIWSKPGGGLMLGMGRTVKNGKTVSFEFMQFREENESLVFMPQPQGGARVSFPLKLAIAGRLTFENLKHDFPQRVIYERKTKWLLLASIEGTLNGKQERQEYPMIKVSCN
jgi:hypothetical protein